MVNSNPAVKDLADQITSSEKNKNVEKSLNDLKESNETLAENTKEVDKSLDELKDSIDSLSGEVKKRGVKSTNTTSDKTKLNKTDNDASSSFSEMLKGFSKGFFNPFTDTNKLVDEMMHARQGEIPADKLKTNNIETKEDTAEAKIVEQQEEPTKEKKPKVEKKTKTKDPELSNKLLVSISQMLNELRENTIEKQLLVEAMKIRAILEKEDAKIAPAENIVPTEQLITNTPNEPDAQGRIEPYLEEEKQKNTIQRLSANDKNTSMPPVHGEVILPEKDNEEKKAKERELLAQAIADKLADLLGNIGGNSGLSIPEVPGAPGKPGKTPGKTPNKLGGIKGIGNAAIPLMLGGILDNLISEGIGALGLGTSASQHDEIYNDMRKQHEESKQNDNSLDVLKNLNILGSDDVAPKPSPMSQYNKDLPAQKESKPIQLTPKEVQNSGSILQNIFKANEDLKSQESQSSTQQMLPPIISNQTTNNTSQTLMPAPPVPNQNTNSYLQWQKSKVNY
jgi:hypothetical protein